jgi:phosphoesterase RecJ-like protein
MNLVDQARQVLLITHVSPDGDAIGSMLGLGWMLRARGKSVTMACEDRVPSVYRWLPGSEDIVQRCAGPCDLVVSLDCSDRRRMGTVFQPEFESLPLINIDHHVTNTEFGTVNWIDPSSVATAQMILSLADVIGSEVTEDIATCLLTGLVTDTRGFRTSNVDAVALGAALRLVEVGASFPEVTRRSLEQRPLASVLLWGQAISDLHFEEGILWTEVTQSMRNRLSVAENGDSGLANFLSGIREADVVVVFGERKGGVIDVGMRAIPGLDVARVALSLGGGGHPQAAGCTLQGDLSSVRREVLGEVQQSVKMQREGRTEE